MSFQTGEYKPRVGLDSLYVAAVTTDELGNYVAGTPEYLAPAAEASQASAINSETIYADDQAYEQFTTKGETTINLSVTNVPLELLSRLTGQKFDDASGIFYEHGGVPPDYALLFRSMKSNGSYRYYAFLKCKFDMPDEEAATKGESPDPKMLALTVHAIKTACRFFLPDSVEDGLIRMIGDEDVTAFDPTGWFDSVQIPAIVSASY